MAHAYHDTPLPCPTIMAHRLPWPHAYHGPRHTMTQAYHDPRPTMAPAYRGARLPWSPPTMTPTMAPIQWPHDYHGLTPTMVPAYHDPYHGPPYNGPTTSMASRLPWSPHTMVTAYHGLRLSMAPYHTMATYHGDLPWALTMAPRLTIMSSRLP